MFDIAFCFFPWRFSGLSSVSCLFNLPFLPQSLAQYFRREHNSEVIAFWLISLYNVRQRSAFRTTILLSD